MAGWEWPVGQKCPLRTELWSRTMDGAPVHGACRWLLISCIPGDDKTVVPEHGNKQGSFFLAPSHLLKRVLCLARDTMTEHMQPFGCSCFRSARSSRLEQAMVHGLVVPVFVAILRIARTPHSRPALASQIALGLPGVVAKAVAMQRQEIGCCYTNLITCLARASK